MMTERQRQDMEIQSQMHGLPEFECGIGPSCYVVQMLSKSAASAVLKNNQLIWFPVRKGEPKDMVDITVDPHEGPPGATAHLPMGSAPASSSMQGESRAAAFPMQGRLEAVPLSADEAQSEVSEATYEMGSIVNEGDSAAGDGSGESEADAPLHWGTVTVQMVRKLTGLMLQQRKAADQGLVLDYATAQEVHRCNVFLRACQERNA